MSSRGEVMPQLAEYLREMAERIENGSATRKDAEGLRRLADQAAGLHHTWTIKVHGTRGRSKLGARGVDRQFAMARAIKAYKDERGCTNEAAYEALSGRFNNVGPETLKKAWQKMGPLLSEDDDTIRTVLFFERLEAQGLASVTRKTRVK